MDILNRKRVAELEAQLEARLEEVRALEQENNDLRVCLDRATVDLERILNAKQTIPEGCTPGPWCKACGFGKAWASHYHAKSSYWIDGYDTICSGYLCGKGNSCKNFVQKGV